MLYPFFEQAARSPTRQKSFRQLLAMHLLVVGGVLIVYGLDPRRSLTSMMGLTLLLAGIVEGALLVGWRLTQLPKSKFLEPLLLSPVPAPMVMLGEELVGLALLALMMFSSTPIFVALIAARWMTPIEAAIILGHGLLWGAITGLGLASWAYETETVRKWGTRFSGLMLFLYLVIGGLLGEQTFGLLSALPGGLGFWIRDTFFFMHFNNPFSLAHFLGLQNQPNLLLRFAWIEGAGIVAATFFLLRAAFRLKGHFIDRHFRPIADVSKANRGTITDRPLNWWAVRRVSEYAGHVNLYLAFGASIAYSAYLVMGDRWPQWLGRHVFIILEMLGGVPAITTVLFLLAAVPFAYQYGLWDSSIPDRCRRLELLLLTDLQPDDYSQASWMASWRRGRGYVVAALILLTAGWWSGRYPLANTLLALVIGIMTVVLYFAVSFRVFAKNTGGTSLGFVLTVALPLLTWGIGTSGYAAAASYLPAGALFNSFTAQSLAQWLPIAMILVVSFLISAWLFRQSLQRFDGELRTWFDRNSGKHA